MLRRGLLDGVRPRSCRPCTTAIPAATAALRRPRGLQRGADRAHRGHGAPSIPEHGGLPAAAAPARAELARALGSHPQGESTQLSVLPAVDLLQVGDDYYVADGHNRVAAARQAGAVAVDGEVTELLMPGVAPGAAKGAPQRRGHAAGRGRRAAAGRQRAAIPNRRASAERGRAAARGAHRRERDRRGWPSDRSASPAVAR